MNCPKDNENVPDSQCNHCREYCMPKDGDRFIQQRLNHLMTLQKRRDDALKLAYIFSCPQLIRPYYEWIEYGKVNNN